VLSALFWDITQHIISTDVSGQPIGHILNGQQVSPALRKISKRAHISSTSL